MRLIDADDLKQSDFQDFSKTDILSAIDGAPTIEHPHGKWKNGEKDDYPHCTNCDYMPMFDRHIDDIYYSPFCPNCGAKMEDI